MLYRQSGFSPVRVEATGPLMAETTSNYDLQSGVGLSVMLSGAETGVVVSQNDQPGEATLTLTAAPRFLGHWLIGPFFPIPVIPLFGIGRQSPRNQVVLVAWGHPTRKVGIEVEDTWVRIDEAESTTPLSHVVDRFHHQEGLVEEDAPTAWIPNLPEGTGPAADRGSVALVFDVSPHGAERMTANVAILLENGERGSIRIDLQMRSTFGYDPLGMGVGPRYYE